MPGAGDGAPCSVHCICAFHERPADHLVNGGFDEGGADSFALASAIAEIWDERLIVPDVGFEVGQFIHHLGGKAERSCSILELKEEAGQRHCHSSRCEVRK